MDVNARAQRPSFWGPFVSAAGQGEFMLQVCANCSAVKYPPAEICAECLGAALEWTPVSGLGRVLATTEIRATPDDFFQPLLPVAIGSVKLECGPVVIAFFADPDLGKGTEVTVESAIDVAGAAVLVAHNQNTSIASDAFEWKGSSLQQLFSVRN